MTDTSARRFRSELHRLYAGVLMILLLALAVTTGWRHVSMRDIEHASVRQRGVVIERATARLQRDFTTIEEELRHIGHRLSSDPVVVDALASRGTGNRPYEEAVRYFSGLDLPERHAAELYVGTGTLVAWKGFSMPLSLPFNPSESTSIISDTDARIALVVTTPVAADGQTVGYVRVLRLVRVRTPVQNEYLRDYSLASAWSASTALTVRMEAHGSAVQDIPPNARPLTLQSRSGVPLLDVWILPPETSALARVAMGRLDGILAFEVVLLLLWISALLWNTYRRREHGMVSHRLSRPVAFALWAVSWWVLRFGMLYLDVPARFQGGKTPFAPLFDPTHLASLFGYGLMRSAGDLFITSTFLLVFGAAFFHLLTTRHAERMHRQGWGHLAASVLLFLGAGALVVVVAAVVEHTILDSTLDFFGRTNLWPARSERLILVVYGALLISTLGFLLIAAALVDLAIRPLLGVNSTRRTRWLMVIVACMASLAAGAVLVSSAGFSRNYLWPAALFWVLSAVGVAVLWTLRNRRLLPMLTLRGVLLFTFVLSVLLYPLFYNGMDTRRRLLMTTAAESFDEGRDPRVLFAIEQAIREAYTQLADAASPVDSSLTLSLDSLATELVRGSLLSSMGPYDVGLVFLDGAGRTVGRYYEAEEVLGRVVLAEDDSLMFDVLKAMYAEQGSTGILVEQVTGRVERDRFQYVGVSSVEQRGGPVQWVMVRAEPQSRMSLAETPFPRVLLPGAFAGTLRNNMSVAEFRNDLLIRSIGQDFGRFRLRDDVRLALLNVADFWTTDRIEEIRYLTYYRRQAAAPVPGLPPISAPLSTVVSVRLPALNPFDHLYYLLRLTTSGLLLGLPLYLFGLGLRRRAGLLPAPRVRYRDKVLNAFLMVGILAVLAVGIVGRAFVAEGEETAVHTWLRQNLERVEETLAFEAGPEELPYSVLGRMPVDSLAARVGLELNVYRGYDLVGSSRAQLVRDRLIDRRLPVDVWRSVFLEGSRFVVTDERIGRFSYKAGYRALLDEEGRPQYVVSVPTLAQQERLEEEQARTVAYLFGALLLLVLVVMLTAAVLADALARPIARLRDGLEAAAQGKFERTIPVESRDEIGELVETFNAMQEQLADSRRILAQQERQLAWREMARQVAHEIKNPLTPMKLSVQHLRRAYDDLESRSDGESARPPARFASLFERITGTLIEQIDALARIANEFHSFARMPSRILERLDLNAVIREAISLMQEDSDTEVTFNSHPEPLVVEADREELRRAFINLIKNGIEAVPGGQSKSIVVTTATEVREEIEVALATVTDNGTGIPPELHEKIFQPNFSTKTRGTGLGLAITRKSVEDFGGEIGFETRLGEGSTFWIRFRTVD